MKLVLIGATGYVGSALLKEALDRGHEVTVIARDPEKIAQQSNLVIQKGDVQNQDELGKLFIGHAAVISAFSGFNAKEPDGYAAQINGTHSIINAVKQAGIPRLLMVGGAGSLEVAPGKRLLETPEFPAEWKEMALAMTEVLSILKQQRDLDWTLLSPSAQLQPGERTNQFRLGADQPIRNAQGESKISTQDYAVAMLNELEHPQHSRQRFTVGY